MMLKNICYKKFNPYFLALLLSSLFLHLSCSKESNQAVPEKILLGGITPLSGSASLYGRIDKLVTDMYVDQLNANGGINGREAKVIWHDSKCSPEASKEASQALIDMGITIILGDGCSGATMASAEVTEANQVILFTSISSSTSIKNAGDFVFRVQPSDETSSKTLATHANSQYTSIGILTEQTEYAESFTNDFLNHYNGTTIDQRFPSSQTDFQTSITEFISQDVDAIFIVPQESNKMKTILEQLVTLNWNKDVFGNEMIQIDKEIVSEFKSHFASWNTVSTDFIVPESAALGQLKEDFQFEYGEPLILTNYGATTIDRNNVLKQVLESVKDETNTTAIRDAIYNIQNYKGLSGTFSFDTYGEVDLINQLLIFNGETFVPKQ